MTTPVRTFAAVAVLWSATSILTLPQQGPDNNGPERLLKILLSTDTSESQWRAMESGFEKLPPRQALRALFPEIARGYPNGATYASYNCSDPDHDRTNPGWGRFCVVNWLWCRELGCSGRRREVSAALLELWSEPTSHYGRMVLLQSLCRDRAAESNIRAVFSDTEADARFRTEAVVCLLYQDGTRYHSDAVAFAHQNNGGLRERLFEELVSPLHRKISGIDPAVVRLGFDLLLQAQDKAQKAKQVAKPISDYGAFLIADRLNRYLECSFEPDQKEAIYAGSIGVERWYHDTVVNALHWWAIHKADNAT